MWITLREQSAPGSLFTVTEICWDWDERRSVTGTFWVKQFNSGQ